MVSCNINLYVFSCFQYNTKFTFVVKIVIFLRWFWNISRKVQYIDVGGTREWGSMAGLGDGQQ